LRAAGYLLTYNLIEATARNAVTSVFDHLRNKVVTFDTLNSQLKCILLTHAQRRNPDELAEELQSIATDLVAKAFDSKRLFSGNVDARKLREMAEKVVYASTKDTHRALKHRVHDALTQPVIVRNVWRRSRDGSRSRPIY
jgi:hypothetical protein